MIDEFWIEKADVYSDIGFEINELGTHPHLITFFNRYCSDAKKVLDYGCGDGSLLLKIKKAFEISIFDISPSILEIAKAKLKDKNPRVFSEANSLPVNYYDCIFISMVFICVSSSDEIDFIIDKAISSKKEEGIILVSNPHPCFRDKPFSSYYTEYSIGKEFNYFKSGEKHKIYIRGTDMEFFDYNWSLEFIINAFLKRGLKLLEIQEIKDNPTNEFFNKKHSPSIIYAFK